MMKLVADEEMPVPGTDRQKRALGSSCRAASTCLYGGSRVDIERECSR
jgi:hypothetical protein